MATVSAPGTPRQTHEKPVPQIRNFTRVSAGPQVPVDPAAPAARPVPSPNSPRSSCETDRDAHTRLVGQLDTLPSLHMTDRVQKQTAELQNDLLDKMRDQQHQNRADLNAVEAGLRGEIEHAVADLRTHVEDDQRAVSRDLQKRLETLEAQIRNANLRPEDRRGSVHSSPPQSPRASRGRAASPGRAPSPGPAPSPGQAPSPGRAPSPPHAQLQSAPAPVRSPPHTFRSGAPALPPKPKSGPPAWHSSPPSSSRTPAALAPPRPAVASSHRLPVDPSRSASSPGTPVSHHSYVPPIVLQRSSSVDKAAPRTSSYSPPARHSCTLWTARPVHVARPGSTGGSHSYVPPQRAQSVFVRPKGAPAVAGHGSPTLGGGPRKVQQVPVVVLPRT